MPANPIGTASNLDGIAYEKHIQAALSKQGWPTKTRYTLEGEKGGSIYGTGALISAFVEPCDKFPHGLAVDATCQHSSGTAYQKLPYKVFSAAKAWRLPCILIIHGNGRGMAPARRWARAWHRANRERYPHFLGVMGDSEFIEWCEREGACSSQIYIPEKPQVIQIGLGI